MEAPVASIVMPTYNGANMLPGTLAAVLAQQGDIRYEVIVVDDGSTDETPAVLEEWRTMHPDRLRFLSQINAGPARARNRGAAEARGNFLVFLDDDCVPEGNWLVRLDAARRCAPPGAVAGKVVNPAPNWVGRYVVLERVIDHVVVDGLITEAVTANLGVDRELFAKVGGFNEQIAVAGGEDTQFSVQLRSLGFPIVYAPDAVVHHKRELTTRSYLAMMHRHGRGRYGLGKAVPAYSLTFAPLRLIWVIWPIRRWMARDYRRYCSEGVTRSDALKYVLLRYAGNIARLTGYLREGR